MSQPATKKCTCFDDKLDVAKEHFGRVMQGDVTELDARWKGYSYLSGDYCPVNPSIELTYRELKRNGEPKANLTKQLVIITCEYCPWCGRKLEKGREEA